MSMMSSMSTTSTCLLGLPALVACVSAGASPTPAPFSSKFTPGPEGEVDMSVIDARQSPLQSMGCTLNGSDPDRTLCTLDKLLTPLPPGAYFEELMERVPVHIRRPEAFYDNLDIGFDAADRIIGTVLAETRWYKEVSELCGKAKYRTECLEPCEWEENAGCVLTASVEACDVVSNGFEQGAGLTAKHLKRIHTGGKTPWNGYLLGATVICDTASVYDPALTQLIMDLGNQTSGKWVANVYLTPPGTHGFTAHNDQNDGLIVQGAGSKHWTFHKSAANYPQWKTTRGRPNEEAIGDQIGPMLWNDVVAKGDVLLIPRGMYHYAEVTADGSVGSIHYTVSPLPSPGWLNWEAIVLEVLRGVQKDKDMDKKIREVADHCLVAIGAGFRDPVASAPLRRSIWDPQYNTTAGRSKLREGIEANLERVRVSLWDAAKEMGREDDLKDYGKMWPTLLNRALDLQNINAGLNNPLLAKDRIRATALQEKTLKRAQKGNIPPPLHYATSVVERVGAGRVTVAADPAADTTNADVPRFITIESRNGKVVVLQVHEEAVKFVTEMIPGETFVVSKIPTTDPFTAVAIVRILEDIGIVKVTGDVQSPDVPADEPHLPSHTEL